MGFTSLDVNLRLLTSFNGSEVRRYKVRFVSTLSRRARKGSRAETAIVLENLGRLLENAGNKRVLDSLLVSFSNIATW